MCLLVQSVVTPQYDVDCLLNCKIKLRRARSELHSSCKFTITEHVPIAIVCTCLLLGAIVLLISMHGNLDWNLHRC